MFYVAMSVMGQTPEIISTTNSLLEAQKELKFRQKHFAYENYKYFILVVMA